MRSKLILFLIIYFTFCNELQSQFRLSVLDQFQASLNVGPLFFLGDLGGGVGTGTKFIKDINLPETKLSFEFNITYKPFEWLGIRSGFLHGTISGNDKNSPNNLPIDTYLFERNLNFQSKLDEIHLGIEFVPLHIFSFREKSFLNKLQLYGFTGVGAFIFNPKTIDIDGELVELRPLRLEGQGFSEYPTTQTYSLLQANVLTGVGIRYFINANTFFGIETIHRILFSDYIDDVSEKYYVDPLLFDKYLSPENAIRAKRLYYRGFYNLGGSLPHKAGLVRGNPKNTDAYFTISIQFGTKLFRQKYKGLKCPSNF